MSDQDQDDDVQDHENVGSSNGEESVPQEEEHENEEEKDDQEEMNEHKDTVSQSEELNEDEEEAEGQKQQEEATTEAEEEEQQDEGVTEVEEEQQEEATTEIGEEQQELEQEEAKDGSETENQSTAEQYDDDFERPTSAGSRHSSTQSHQSNRATSRNSRNSEKADERDDTTSIHSHVSRKSSTASSSGRGSLQSRVSNVSEQSKSAGSNDTRPKSSQSKYSRPSSVATSERGSVKSERRQSEVSRASRPPSAISIKSTERPASGVSKASSNNSKTPCRLSSGVSRVSEKQSAPSSRKSSNSERLNSAGSSKTLRTGSAKSRISKAGSVSQSDRPLSATSRRSAKSSKSHSEQDVDHNKEVSEPQQEIEHSRSVDNVNPDTGDGDGNQDSQLTGSNTSVRKDHNRSNSEESRRSGKDIPRPSSGSGGEGTQRPDSRCSNASKSSDKSRIEEVANANDHNSITQSSTDLHNDRRDSKQSIKSDNKSAVVQQTHETETVTENESDEEIQKLAEDQQDTKERPDEDDDMMRADTVVDEHGHFHSAKFLSALRKLTDTLESEKYQDPDSNVSCDDMTKFVQHVGNTVGKFQSYASQSQDELQRLRETLKDLNGKIHSTIDGRSYKPQASDGRKSVAERELEVKRAELNREVAQMAEQLTKAATVILETEQNAIDATLAAQQACDEAQQVEEQLEAKRLAAEEEKQKEQLHQEEQKKIQEEEENKQKEIERHEQERIEKLMKQEEEKEIWSDWLAHEYKSKDDKEKLLCIVKGKPGSFNPNSVTCDIMEQTLGNFVYGDAEELISDILKVQIDGSQLESEAFIAIPYHQTKQTGATKEATVKAEVDGEWEELRSRDVILEEQKDYKFVIAPLTKTATMAVVFRSKKDYLIMPKRGGKVMSTVDNRLLFIAEKQTFPQNEHFVVQMQPVEPSVQQEIRGKKNGSRDFLSCSAIITMTWSSSEFNKTILVNVPCPPNPARLKRAAKLKAQKEAALAKKEKMKRMEALDDRILVTPKPTPSVDKSATPTSPDQSKGEDEEPPKTLNRWYMGQYGDPDTEESENQYVIRKSPSTGKWRIYENDVIKAVRSDVLQIKLTEPLQRIMVMRVWNTSKKSSVQDLAETVETYSNRRVAIAILRQSVSDPHRFMFYVAPSHKVDQLDEELDESGYSDGPGFSEDLTTHEGELITIGFRGNIEADLGQENAEHQLNMDDNNKINSIEQQPRDDRDDHTNAEDGDSSSQVIVAEETDVPQEQPNIDQENKPNETQQDSVSIRSEPTEEQRVVAEKKGKEIKLKEPEAKTELNTLDIIYNSNLTNKVEFTLCQVNKFLQRNFRNYRGFVQLLKKNSSDHKVKKETGNSRKKKAVVQDVKNELMCEFLVEIPKPDDILLQRPRSRPIPVTIKNPRDPVTEDNLRHLAGHLGDEWQTVAHHLNIKPMRIQAILRSCENVEADDVKLDMLMSWAKRIPQGWNKVEILRNAVKRIGRTDLVDYLNDIEASFKSMMQRKNEKHYDYDM